LKERNRKKVESFEQSPKTIWQKITQIKVPEFNEKVKEGFLNYKKAEETLKL
jgi:hypothetical protein